MIPSKEKKSVPLLYKIHLLLCMMFLSFQYGGAILFVPIYNGSVNFACFALIIVLSFSLDTSTLNRLSGKYKGLSILLFLLFAFIYFLTEQVTFVNSQLMTFLHCFCIFLIFVFYSDKPHMQKPLLAFLAADLLIKMGINLYALYTNPFIMRNAGFENFTFQSGWIRLVSNHINQIAAGTSLVLLGMYSKMRKSFRKYVILLVILSFILLYFSNFTLPLLAFLILVVFQMFVKTDKIALALTITLIGVVLIYPNISAMLIWLADSGWFGLDTTGKLYDSARILSNREVYTSLNGNLTSAQARSYYYSLSFKAVQHNFFFGKFTPDALTAGGHSTWLDYLAKYGVILISPLYIFLGKSFKNFAEIFQAKKSVLLLFAYFLIMGIINAFQISTLFLVLFIILPFASNLLIEKGGESIENPLGHKPADR